MQEGREKGAVEVLNQTPFPFIALPGRMGYPRHSLTVAVKATLHLQTGGVATTADEQIYPTGDVPYPDDEEQTGGPRCDSDFACFKPRADLLLAGPMFWWTLLFFLGGA